MRIRIPLITAVVLAALMVPSSGAAASVTVTSTATGNQSVAVPWAPKYSRIQSRINSGYLKLARTARDLCGHGHYAFSAPDFTPLPGTSSFTASRRLVDEFRAVRSDLVPITTSYGLGYPPSLEDFSNVGAVLLTRIGRSGLLNFKPVSVFVGCTFEV